MATQFVGVFSLGTTLDRGLRLFKLAWRKVVPLVLFPFLLGAGAWIGLFHEFMSSGFSDDLTYLPLYIIGILLNVLGSVWAWVVSTRYIYELSIGKKPSTSEMLRLATFKDLLLIFTFLLWGLVAVAGFIALIVPYFYIVNIMSIGVILSIVERNFFTDGISRTFKLVKNRWWKTLGLNIIAGMVAYIPIMVGMMVLVFVSVLVIAFTQSSESEQVPGVLFSIYQIVYFAMFSLAAPVISSIQIVHYHSLRCEKESFDIESQIEQIGDESSNEPSQALQDKGISLSKSEDESVLK